MFGVVSKIEAGGLSSSNQTLTLGIGVFENDATEDSLAKKFSTTRKTLRKHVWPVVKKIASLADSVVSSSFVVDCCMIQFFRTILYRTGTPTIACHRFAGRIGFVAILLRHANALSMVRIVVFMNRTHLTVNGFHTSSRRPDYGTK